MHAQHLVHNRKDPSQMHSFPAFPLMNPAKMKAREEIRKAQQILEAKQREEEDRLLLVSQHGLKSRLFNWSTGLILFQLVLSVFLFVLLQDYFHNHSNLNETLK
jgi:hypothetical protein